MELNNAKILISGANRGLGRALLEALLQYPVQTVYAGVRQPENFSHSDKRVIPVQLDVTDAESVAAVGIRISELDLLINNAGALTFGNILEATEEDLDANINVNLKGVWRLSRALAPALTARRGTLCNILSVLSLASMPGLAAYNLSKAAAWSATQSLRATLQPNGVSVRGVYPGAIDTDMIADVEMDKADPADIARDIVDGLLENTEDIFPGQAQDVYRAWQEDHKSVERQFAAA